MKEIGGYFGLELPLDVDGEYHDEAYRLNTARNAFGEILKARGYRKVYMPRYTCEVMYEPINALGIDVERYEIDFNLNPVRNVKLKDGEAYLYTNYYGLKDATVSRLTARYGAGLIVDNAQSFYSEPMDGIDTIYSARKFFGVSDGAYLYSEAVSGEPEETDYSCARMAPQLKRVDGGACAGYADFQNSEEGLCGQPPKRMSRLTRTILSGLDYDKIAGSRRDNFKTLEASLKNLNGVRFKLGREDVPMAYPFYVEDESLRSRLIANKVFVPTYWPNVIDECAEGTVEHSLAKYLVPLPVDQRYDKEDMQTIIDIIKR